eukprot:TRINITY_DN12161_c0_g2_i2.p3 TRINITY_DN12161_c0_g2~~TRINITY_DN12161_c0_g2_i2.p3  ORF type:complete len:160 (-),score=16.37 TRINITY_DN12161_c0_g2_i2:46-483(-)
MQQKLNKQLESTKTEFTIQSSLQSLFARLMQTHQNFQLLFGGETLNDMATCLVSWTPQDILEVFAKNLNIVSRFGIKLGNRIDTSTKLLQYFSYLDSKGKKGVLNKLINWNEKEVLLGFYMQAYGQLLNDDVKMVLVDKVNSFED